MTKRETIGIYGGTFDPPHLGHVHAAETAMETLGLDRLLVIPAGIPPHKQLPQETASGEDRLEMARLAFGEIPNAEFSDMELCRQGKSYTVETLRRLHEEHPAAELTFFAGTDMLLTFEQWYEFREILRLARLAVFARAEGDDVPIFDCAARLREKYGADVVFIPGDVVEISSSQIRRMLVQRQGREYLTDGVYAYILRHGLYGARAELQWLREKILPTLKPTRARHTLGVEETAAALARRWGADETSAREAAILHDAAKYLPLEQQLHLCNKYGIIVDEQERESTALLHGKTASVIAASEYGASSEVCSAIRYHTTGREDMTLPEKILYLADYIEPNRSFPGVEKVRALAQTDLDGALLLAFEMSLSNLHERGIVPHENTCRAARWLRTQTEGKGEL